MSLFGAFSMLAPLLQEFLKNSDLALLLPPRQPPARTEPQVQLGWGPTPPRRIPIHPPTLATAEMVATLLRSRRNWLSDTDALSRVEELCRQIVRNLGVLPDDVSAIAHAETVEVAIPAVSTDAHHFPWEFVLIEATRQDAVQRSRSEHPLAVVRHMQPVVASRQRARQPEAPPVVLLFIKSAPGRLAGQYEFDSEERLLSASLNLATEPIILPNPTVREIRQQMEADKPDIVHISGIDAFQGAELLGVPRSDAISGMYLTENGQAAVVDYNRLADILSPSGAKRPRLITFNMYNSAEGAAVAVARGAAAAIGFQDTIDDALAEQFLASFYSEWKHTEWDLVAAFRTALISVAPHKRARGSGIVLWSATSMLERRPPRTTQAAPSGGREEIISADSAADAHASIAIFCKPLEKLNYSMMHNNGDLYSEFAIRRQRPGTYRGISVDVRLAAGVEEAVYRTTINLDDRKPVEYLHRKVRLALTSRFSRMLEESMFGTISTTVRWGRHVLYDETDRVELLPVDEWRFDELSGHWLPSFVFPRDPVVRQIIEAAQRYLLALRDDSAAGFDGYQGFDHASDSMNEQCRTIDAQVQAIWWALVHDFAPSYINPPPSFAANAQRLRTPSDVIEGKRGTCIDLTLLLASCLEYIDIYPVIFLLSDHAFPGYWRSERSYELLTTANLTPVAAPDPQSTDAATAISASTPWMQGPEQFGDIVGFVQSGHIVPMESTLLTSRGGFWDAVREGAQNLRSKRHFHSMFDLRKARQYVTPVPVWSKGA